MRRKILTIYEVGKNQKVVLCYSHILFAFTIDDSLLIME